MTPSSNSPPPAMNGRDPLAHTARSARLTLASQMVGAAQEKDDLHARIRRMTITAARQEAYRAGHYMGSNDGYREGHAVATAAARGRTLGGAIAALCAGMIIGAAITAYAIHMAVHSAAG